MTDRIINVCGYGIWGGLFLCAGTLVAAFYTWATGGGSTNLFLIPAGFMGVSMLSLIVACIVSLVPRRVVE